MPENPEDGVDLSNVLSEVEIQMKMTSCLSRRVYFHNPMEAHPYMLTRKQWERMGEPVYIRVRVWPVRPDGRPWHEKESS